MAADASIYGLIQPARTVNPLAGLMEVQQIQAAQQQNQLAQLAFADRQRQQAEQERLRGIYAGGAQGPELEAALLRGGFADQALKFGKDRRESQKLDVDTQAKQVETSIKRLEVAGQAFGAVRSAPTPENAASTINYLTQNGIFSPEQGQQYLQRIAQASPQEIAQLADQAFRSTLDAKEQLAKYVTSNTGQQTVTNAIDPVTGQTRVVNAMQNTASPESVLSAQTAQANAALSAATQRRGQDMSDTRARELNDINRQSARTQVVETPEGVMLVDKGTGLARPAATMNGQALPGKPSEAQRKEIMSINQQRSIVQGAIDAANATPDAFSFGRGVAGKLPFGETLAGRTETPEQTQARAYVFNNVSRVINERAGAAQSAQELQRLNSFLPADTDTAEQVRNKLVGFQRYLDDLESGTRGNPRQPKPADSGGWSVKEVK
jgi:hypothetical protein